LAKGKSGKDGVPVFLTRTNREIADIVKDRPTSLEALKAVKEFSNGKIGRYSEDIITIIRDLYEKT